MHTIQRQNKDEWYVGRMVQVGNVSEFVPLFQGMSVWSACQLCSMLNGGEAIAWTAGLLQALAVK